MIVRIWLAICTVKYYFIYSMFWVILNDFCAFSFMGNCQCTSCIVFQSFWWVNMITDSLTVTVAGSLFDRSWSTRSRGATTSSKLWVQFLGLEYYYPSTEKLDRFIRIRFGTVGYIITLYSSKSYVKRWGVRLIIGEFRTPRPPSGYTHDTVQLVLYNKQLVL